LIYAITDLFITPAPKPAVTEHLVVLVTPRVIAREQAEAAVARPMPCGPCTPVPVQQCATAELAPRPLPMKPMVAPCCPPPVRDYVVAPPAPCPMPVAPAPMAMPELPLPQIQLNMCLLSLDPAFWDRPEAAAWSDLSPKACEGKPKMLSAGEAQRFCQAMRSMKYGKFLAEPKMMTLSGRSATFLSGNDQMCLTGLTVADGPDGCARPLVETSSMPFGIQMTMLPTVCGDRIHLDCTCTTSVPGKEYRLTIQAAGEEPRSSTVCALLKGPQPVNFTAEVPNVGRALLFHCGRDANGREVIVTVAPSMVQPPPVAAYALPPMSAPCVPPIMPTVWSAPMPMPSIRPLPEEPPFDPKLMKFMVKYQRACADGDTAKARKFAEKCLAIDPTCFGK
jgi:hypothetical protein